MCSVPFGLVAARLGRIAALNDGALGGIARLGGVDLSRGRRGRVGADDLSLGLAVVPRTVNGTGHTGPSEFCATSI